MNRPHRTPSTRSTRNSRRTAEVTLPSQGLPPSNHSSSKNTPVTLQATTMDIQDQNRNNPTADEGVVYTRSAQRENYGDPRIQPTVPVKKDETGSPDPTQLTPVEEVATTANVAIQQAIEWAL